MREQQSPDVIAIDGPAASGKTTIGYMLAQQLGYLFLDTGCMYRALTLAALDQGVPVDDEPAITSLAHEIDIKIVSNSVKDGRRYTVMLNGRDVTWDIRSAEVTTHVSLVSSYVGVRQEMVRRQRRIAKDNKVVMVGRDIGTVVLPHAPLKFYMVATAEERAARRWLELRQRGKEQTYRAILEDVERRDEMDSSRAHSPLRPAEDAILLETTSRDPESVLDLILRQIESHKPVTSNNQKEASAP